MPNPQEKKLYEADPTDEQLQRAKRIASKTGQTVAQVLAQAISRGTSAQYSDAMSGRSALGTRH